MCIPASYLDTLMLDLHIVSPTCSTSMLPEPVYKQDVFRTSAHLGCLSTHGTCCAGFSMPNAFARRLERFWRSHSASQVRMPGRCPAGTAVWDTRRPQGHFSVTFCSGGGCGLPDGTHISLCKAVDPPTT